MRIRTLLLGALVSVGLLATAVPAAAQPSDQLVQVIVRLQAGADPAAESQEATRQGGRLRFTYRNALRGYAITVPGRLVPILQRSPRVVSVEIDTPVRTTGDQSNPPSWGLDRIDQRNLPLTKTYSYPNADPVRAYVVDSGVRTSHSDFGGRVDPGYTAVSDGRGTEDCNGHGTHVAGTVAGTTHGVAKSARVVPVRVLDCGGSGLTSSVIAGVDWVAANHPVGTPGVANLSLGGGTSAALDTAIDNLVGKGVSVVVSAGNDNKDACTQSPARVPAAITVGATTTADARASYSNFGRCLDLFAPGSGITSAWIDSNSATRSISGTSMASPHVAGAAALVLSREPTLTPTQVAASLTSSATTGKVTSPGTSSPNRLLFVDGPVTTGPTVTNPGPQTATVGAAIPPLQLTASGATGPLTWSAINLPPDLSVDPSSGLVSGTPRTAGTYNVTVTAAPTTGAPSGTTSFTWTVSDAPAAPACSGQLLTNGGFEQQPTLTGWSTTGAVATRAPRTGSGNAVLGGSGVAGTSTMSQSVAIPTGCRTYRLSFYLRVETQERTFASRDQLAVTLGSTQLATYSNLNASRSYAQRSFTISGQAGKTVTLTFTARENAGGPTSFSIDDVVVATS